MFGYYLLEKVLNDEQDSSKLSFNIKIYLELITDLVSVLDWCNCFYLFQLNQCLGEQKTYIQLHVGLYQPSPD